MSAPTPETVAREWWRDTDTTLPEGWKALAALIAAQRAEAFAEGLECAAKVVIDEIDGGDECRARDSQLSRIVDRIRALRAPESGR
jgi:hypothetical protein